MDAFDIECDACGEEFEADEDLYGETVDCPECGSPIQIPHEDEIEDVDEEEEDVLEERSSPRTPRGRSGDKRRSTSSKGRSSRKGPSRGKASGSNKNLLIGGGVLGALVLVIVVVAVLAGGGDGTQPSGKGKGKKKGGSQNSSSSSDDEPAMDPDLRAEKESLYRKELAEAEESDDPAAWVKAGDRAAEAGLKGKAKSAYERALDAKEGYKPALKKLDYKRFTLSEEASELEIVAGDALRQLDDYAGKWLSPKDFEKASKLQTEIVAKIMNEQKRRASDPFFDARIQVERVLSTRKGLQNRVFKVNEAKPYLVFEDKGEKGGALKSDRETAEQLGEKLRMLKFMYNYVMKRFFSPLGFKLDERYPLVVIALQDRAAFDKLHQEMGMRIPRGALAYFHRIHKYIILYNGAFKGARQSYLENKAASDGVVFHEGTHQIVDAVLNPGKGFDSMDTIQIPYWMSEGIAEYVGSLSMKDDPDEEGNDVYVPCSINKMRLGEFYRALHPEKDPMIKQMNPIRLARMKKTPITHSFAVDVPRLLECHDHGSTARAMAKMFDDPSEGESAAEIFSNGLPYYQGTYFFYFCYNYKGGKYADHFNRYLASSFKGFYYPDNFKDAFRGVDLKELTREWFAYMEELFEKHLE